MQKNNFLQEIVDYKTELNAKKKIIYNEYRAKVSATQMKRYHVFKKAISKSGGVNLIAELKKASPSKGLLVNDFEVTRYARTYVEQGAVAFSVLTENKYFLGKSEYLRIVTQNFPLPALCKDFFLDEGQIYEAFYWGASAILLIVSILDDDTLKKFIETAGQLDMDCLVEVHDELELERALKAGAGIIGINNRDLHTFQVDLAVSRRLIPQIPSDKVIVSESGIGSHDYVKELGRLGAHAVLIGETFIRAQDVAQKIKEVMQGA